MKRRMFLGAMGASTLAALAGAVQGASVQGASVHGASLALKPVNLAGADLAGWETVVGDGIYARPGLAPVSISDIATVDYGTYSSLLANVERRPVMAHNIAFKRLIDDNLFDYTHDCSYEFRTPDLDIPTRPGTKAQTVEGGLFVWDGSRTRRDYGLGFQWVLNPSDPKFGAIQTWFMSNNNGGWRTVAYKEPDNEWHRFEARIDHKRNNASLWIDGEKISSAYTRRKKPDSWGTETAARLQVEGISLAPGSLMAAPMHTVDVRNWAWDLAPA
jgi:hypothetical protein